MAHTPEGDQVILRDARADEIDAVAGLLAASYADHASAFPPAMWRTYQRDIAALRPRLAVADLVVAVVPDGLVGTVTFYPDAAADEHGWPSGMASLRLLAVPPHARGWGVARALTGECVARARRHGASALGLHTAPFMTAATRLYETMGFVRAPEHDFDPYRHYRAQVTPQTRGRVRGLAYVMPL